MMIVRMRMMKPFMSSFIGHHTTQIHYEST